MAPSKRQRQDDTGDFVEVQSASSSLRGDVQRKKARLSEISNVSKSRNARNRRPSTSSSDEDDLSDGHASDAPAPASTQYEIIRDGGFKHLQNPDEDDLRATQRFLARRQLIGENHAADNSIVQEITCINFMCHDRLHVVLGPLINFIVGMNGSGKSAVLTALTLCLGGKASSTNRGTSLKSLIKGGKDQAILIVKLKNEGNDAYQPELYGESIIVERHFSMTGSTGYRLKSATNRLISSKKGDVDDIVEYFQLQVDNPMNVLTQDAAKSFLHTSTPAQKYKFFVEGVQLEALDNDYRMISDTCDQIQAKLDDSRDDIQALEKKYRHAQAKSDMVHQQQGIRETVRALGRQFAWAQVESLEAEVTKRERVVTESEERIQLAEKEQANQRDMFEQLEQAKERSEEAVRSLEEQVLPVQQEVAEAKEIFDNAIKEVAKAHADQGQIKKSFTEAQTKVKGFQDDINDEMRRLEHMNGGAHAQKLAELEEARKAVEIAKIASNENEKVVPQLDGKALEATNILEKFVQAPLAAKRKEVENCARRLEELRSKRPDEMAGYDRKMPQLLKMIRDDSGFREKPVGPIGLHIKLLEPIWSDIIEAMLGRNLASFVVTNKADQIRLSAMMQRLKFEFAPQILIGNHHPIDTTGHEPESQYQTILKVLEINNDLVKRQLIINQAIEQSVLIKSRVDAEKFMFHGERPKNVKQCFALHDSRRDFNHRLAYTGRNGNQEMAPLRAPNWRPRMRSDIETQIRFQTETLSQLNEELHNLEVQQRQLQQNVQRCKQAIVQHKRTKGSLRVNVQRAEDEVERLQVELDRDNVEDGRLEALKGCLAEAKAEVAMYQDTYGNAGLEKEKLNKVSSEMKAALNAAKERLAEHEGKLLKAQHKLRNTVQARGIALTEVNAAAHIVEEAKRAKIEAEAKCARHVVQLEDFVAQATAVSERVPVEPGETPASLDKKLKKLSTDYKNSIARLGGSAEQIHEAAAEAFQVYETSNTRRTELVELLALLKHSFLKRLDMFHKFQKHIAARSRINFNYLLSERAFRGRLIIDHEAKKLDVHVEPDETSRNAKGRQTKTLSGGEKSFSSICLLLALWEAMGAPMRCLDEFDVFMDDVNRDVSTRMIISAARRSVGRQFILITPKALGAGAADAPDVHIIKLFDPREKQRRIEDMMEAE